MPNRILDLHDIVERWSEDMVQVRQNGLGSDDEELYYFDHHTTDTEIQIDFSKLKFHHGRPDFDDAVEPENLQTEAAVKHRITNNDENEMEITPQMNEKYSSRCQVGVRCYKSHTVNLKNFTCYQFSGFS